MKDKKFSIPKISLGRILNKLFVLIIVFYSGMLGSDKLGASEGVIEGFKNAGTTALGAFIGIIMNKTDDDDDSPTLEDEPFFLGGDDI